MTAPSWTVSVGGAAWASAKSMLDLFNGSSSAKTLDVYRVYICSFPAIPATRSSPRP